MTKISRFLSKSFAASAMFLILAMPALAADVNGNWTVTFNTSQGGGSMELVLEQEGEELKGSVDGDTGRANVTGKIEDDAVTFSHQLPDYGVSADYSGKLEGTSIKGTVSFADGAAMGNFTAERKQ